MIEEIRFHDSGKKINISIDNETQSIPIQAIDKLPTFIKLRQSLDTPLYEKILIDADICYTPYDTPATNLDNVDEQNTIEDVHINNENNDTTSTSYIDIDTNEQDNIINIDGVVTLTIYKNDDSIYVQKNINFKKGHIQDSFINTLPVGEYRATILYKGNKYFQETLLNTIFSVTKRNVNVIFSEENYYGDPTENITIHAYLKDSITNKAINDCVIRYIFNGYNYSTKSNASGEVFLNVTIPDTDPSHCLPYSNSYEEEQNEPGEPYEDEPEIYDFDEDGNIIEIDYSSDNSIPNTELQPTDTNHYLTMEEELEIYSNEEEYNYPNASYLVELYADNDAYYVYAMTNVIANKLPTEITVNQQSEINNNIVTIGGNAVAIYDNLVANVKYGQVTVSFEDTDYTSTTPIVNNGNFTMDIDFAQVNEFNNYTDNTVLIPYPGADGQITSITITKENESVISIGDAIIISAKVQSKADKEAYVKDGMIVFILYNNQNKEVYRYATEIDHTGQAVFLFNTSKKDTYKVKAHYYGIFGYTDSESNIIENIEVE